MQIQLAPGPTKQKNIRVCRGWTAKTEAELCHLQEALGVRVHPMEPIRPHVWVEVQRQASEQRHGRHDEEG